MVDQERMDEERMFQQEEARALDMEQVDHQYESYANPASSLSCFNEVLLLKNYLSGAE